MHKKINFKFMIIEITIRNLIMNVKIKPNRNLKEKLNNKKINFKHFFI